MAVDPGTRTHPTVKPLATMNKKNMQHWELRLGVAQSVVLLGVVTGSIACAFYVGFSSGRRVGFEAALERTLAHTPRFPVAGAADADTEDSSAADVLARLSTKDSTEKITEQLQPVLGAIKSADSHPIGERALEDAPVALDSVHAAAPKVADSKESSHLTLGDVFDSQADSAKREVESAAVTRELEKAPSLGQKPAEISQPVRPEASLAKSASAEKLLAKKSVPEVKAKATLPETTAVSSLANAKKANAEAKKAVDTKTASITTNTPSSNKGNSLIREILPAGWFAQVAAPKKMADATTLANKLKGSGFAVMIEVARVRGEEYYRVIVGPESNKQQADRLVTQLRRENYLQGEPFLRVVK